MIFVAAAAPWVSPFDPNALDVVAKLQGPTLHHLLGTDELGRDLLSRMIAGDRLTLVIAMASTVLASVTGIIWGALAAFSRGWLDSSLMRLADGLMAMPFLLLALICVAGFGASIPSLVLILGVIFAPVTARVIRASVLEELSLEYTLAARAYGARGPRIFLFEILPNTVPVVLTEAAVVASQAILTEAALSFVGVGVQPPNASWGTLLRSGYNAMFESSWYILWPGIAIFLLIWCINNLADHVRSVLDPRQRRAIGSQIV